jgi:hypothetical protein
VALDVYTGVSSSSLPEKMLENTFAIPLKNPLLSSS